jgi:threonine-phosphate decarboxylase
MDSEYRRHTVDYVRSEREELFRRIADIPYLQPFAGSANYLLVRAISGRSAEGIGSRLLERGLIIRDCSTFAGLGADFFRVAVRRSEQNRLLARSIAEIQGNAPGDTF